MCVVGLSLWIQVLDAKEEWNREQYKQKKKNSSEKQNYNINSSKKFTHWKTL